MEYKPRAVIVQIVLDQIDADGMVVDEATSQPIKLFPAQWDQIRDMAESLAAKASAQGE